MKKSTKGLLTIGLSAVAIAGLCYIFKDQIKESKVYKDNDVDGKINKVKTTIKEKMPKVFDREEDFVEDDEIFFDEDGSDEPRDYVSLDPEEDAEKAEEAPEAEAKEDDAEEEVPTIEI